MSNVQFTKWMYPQWDEYVTDVNVNVKSFGYLILHVMEITKQWICICNYWFERG